MRLENGLALGHAAHAANPVVSAVISVLRVVVHMHNHLTMLQKGEGVKVDDKALRVHGKVIGGDDVCQRAVSDVKALKAAARDLDRAARVQVQAKLLEAAARDLDLALFAVDRYIVVLAARDLQQRILISDDYTGIDRAARDDHRAIHVNGGNSLHTDEDTRALGAAVGDRQRSAFSRRKKSVFQLLARKVKHHSGTARGGDGVLLAVRVAQQRDRCLAGQGPERLGKRCRIFVILGSTRVGEREGIGLDEELALDHGLPLGKGNGVALGIHHDRAVSKQVCDRNVAVKARREVCTFDRNADTGICHDRGSTLKDNAVQYDRGVCRGRIQTVTRIL